MIKKFATDLPMDLDKYERDPEEEKRKTREKEKQDRTRTEQKRKKKKDKEQGPSAARLQYEKCLVDDNLYCEHPTWNARNLSSQKREIVKSSMGMISDPSMSHPTVAPVGRHVNKKRMKKPFDNMKKSSSGNTTGLRTLMRETGEYNDIVRTQTRFRTLTENDHFSKNYKVEGKKTVEKDDGNKYNYTLIR